MVAVVPEAQIPTLRFWLEWGGGCLWPTDPETSAVLGYPADLAQLGLVPDLVRRVELLESWHDTALNWADPGGMFPMWNQEECDRFYGEALSVHGELVLALAGRFVVDLAQDRYGCGSGTES